MKNQSIASDLDNVMEGARAVPLQEYETARENIIRGVIENYEQGNSLAEHQYLLTGAYSQIMTLVNAEYSSCPQNLLAHITSLNRFYSERIESFVNSINTHLQNSGYRMLSEQDVNTINKIIAENQNRFRFDLNTDDIHRSPQYEHVINGRFADDLSNTLGDHQEQRISQLEEIDLEYHISYEDVSASESEIESSQGESELIGYQEESQNAGFLISQKKKPESAKSESESESESESQSESQYQSQTSNQGEDRIAYFNFQFHEDNNGYATQTLNQDQFTDPVQYKKYAKKYVKSFFTHAAPALNRLETRAFNNTRFAQLERTQFTGVSSVGSSDSKGNKRKSDALTLNRNGVTLDSSRIRIDRSLVHGEKGTLVLPINDTGKNIDKGKNIVDPQEYEEHRESLRKTANNGASTSRVRDNDGASTSRVRYNDGASTSRVRDEPIDRMNRIVETQAEACPVETVAVASQIVPNDNVSRQNVGHNNPMASITLTIVPTKGFNDPKGCYHHYFSCGTLTTSMLVLLAALLVGFRWKKCDQKTNSFEL